MTAPTTTGSTSGSTTASTSASTTRTRRTRGARPRRTVRLRTRVTFFLSIATLATTLSLGIVTYLLARNYLLDQRMSVAKSQAFANASVVRDELSAPTGNVGELVLTQLRTEGGGCAVVIVPRGDRPEQFDNCTGITADDLPAALREQVESGRYGLQRFETGDRLFVAVGVAINEFGVQYFELFPLRGTEQTLGRIATALFGGAAVSALLVGFVGWWTNRRLLRPLTRVSQAASDIAAGGIDTRMPPETDPDLARLVQSFNDMADAMQNRLEREARFASDVSHELRSPITALAAAVEVLDGRRDELPERSRQALEVVVTQVRRFDQMVMDLLELSRLDAGATELHREEVEFPALIHRIAHRYGFGDVAIDISPKVPVTVHLDKLRFERILANLLDNANQHGGGPTRVAVEPYGRAGILLAVEDAGPGVARSERARIFERFARGSAARHKIGTGLGLSLVAEHAFAHHGEAWVEDRPGGGARFLVSIGDVD